MVSIPGEQRTDGCFRRIIREYKATLKPRETEEFINQYLNRPAAFLVAKWFKKLKASPNVVTVFSLLFGVSSGYCFAKGENSFVLAGGILLQLMIIFDCADGQLARITGKSSSFGKTLDGLADILTHFSIFYGVAFALYRESGNILPFFLAVIAQASMYLHIMLYDHFKNVFINVTKQEYTDRVESIEELREKPHSENQHSKVKLLVSRLYYLFYKLEYIVVSIGYLPITNNFYDLFPDTERIDRATKELFYREMRVSVKIWSLIGDTIHLTIFVVFGILNMISFIFPFLIISTNLLMLFALFYQRVKFKHLGLEREILWQERFD